MKYHLQIHDLGSGSVKPVNIETFTDFHLMMHRLFYWGAMGYACRALLEDNRPQPAVEPEAKQA